MAYRNPFRSGLRELAESLLRQAQVKKEAGQAEAQYQKLQADQAAQVWGGLADQLIGLRQQDLAAKARQDELNALYAREDAKAASAAQAAALATENEAAYEAAMADLRNAQASYAALVRGGASEGMLREAAQTVARLESVVQSVSGAAERRQQIYPGALVPGEIRATGQPRSELPFTTALPGVRGPSIPAQVARAAGWAGMFEQPERVNYSTSWNQTIESARGTVTSVTDTLSRVTAGIGTDIAGPASDYVAALRAAIDSSTNPEAQAAAINAVRNQTFGGLSGSQIELQLGQADIINNSYTAITEVTSEGANTAVTNFRPSDPDSVANLQAWQARLSDMADTGELSPELEAAFASVNTRLDRFANSATEQTTYNDALAVAAANRRAVEAGAQSAEFKANRLDPATLADITTRTDSDTARLVDDAYSTGIIAGVQNNPDAMQALMDYLGLDTAEELQAWSQETRGLRELDAARDRELAALNVRLGEQEYLLGKSKQQIIDMEIPFIQQEWGLKIANAASTLGQTSINKITGALASGVFYGLSPEELQAAATALNISVDGLEAWGQNRVKEINAAADYELEAARLRVQALEQDFEMGGVQIQLAQKALERSVWAAVKEQQDWARLNEQDIVTSISSAVANDDWAALDILMFQLAREDSFTGQQLRINGVTAETLQGLRDTAWNNYENTLARLAADNRYAEATAAEAERALMQNRMLMPYEIEALRLQHQASAAEARNTLATIQFNSAYDAVSKLTQFAQTVSPEFWDTIDERHPFYTRLLAVNGNDVRVTNQMIASYKGRSTFEQWVREEPQRAEGWRALEAIIANPPRWTTDAEGNLIQDANARQMMEDGIFAAFEAMGIKNPIIQGALMESIQTGWVIADTAHRHDVVRLQISSAELAEMLEKNKQEVDPMEINRIADQWNALVVTNTRGMDSFLLTANMTGCFPNIQMTTMGILTSRDEWPARTTDSNLGGTCGDVQDNFIDLANGLEVATREAARWTNYLASLANVQPPSWNPSRRNNPTVPPAEGNPAAPPVFENAR